MLRAWLAAFLLYYAVPVLSQDDTTCNRSPSEIKWLLGSQGETPCRMWWDLGTVCYWWALERFPDDVGMYLAPPDGDICGCNVLAYNLMAACTWAQEEYFNSNWLTEREWSRNCSINSPYNTVRPSVDLGTRVFPAWAYDSPHGGKWNPKRAISIAVQANATSSSPSPPKTQAPPVTQKPPATQPSTQAHSTPSANVASTPEDSSLSQPLQTSSGVSTSPPAMSRSTSTGGTSNIDSSSPSGLSETVKNPEGVQSQVISATDKPVRSGLGGLPLGALVGVVAGALSVLAIGLVALFCFIRRRRRDRPNAFMPVPSPIQEETGYVTSKNNLMLARTRGGGAMSSDPPPSYTETQTSEY